jgi:hypothetical protein
VYTGVLVTGIYHIGVGVSNGVICGPHGGHDRLAYLAGIASTKCGNSVGPIQVLGVISGAVNLFSDVFLFILPLPAIIKLHLPKRQKIGVFLMFSTGAV